MNKDLLSGLRTVFVFLTSGIDDELREYDITWYVNDGDDDGLTNRSAGVG
jgi:hypothetical protein